MANNDLISRSALIAEYDRVHKGPSGRARQLMEEAPVYCPWADPRYEDPIDGQTYLVIVSGKPEENVILERAYCLAEWSNSFGWMLNEWPEMERMIVHSWAELPDDPKESKANETVSL